MRPNVTHVTTDRYPASLWLSLLIPYTDGSGDRYVAWTDAHIPRTERPVRFLRQSIADGEYPIIVH